MALSFLYSFLVQVSY